MFWTDWGAAPKISRAGFDGTNIKVLVSSGLGWPNSVVIDGPARRIYWADAKTDKLESCDFNVSNVSGDQFNKTFTLIIYKSNYCSRPLK